MEDGEGELFANVVVVVVVAAADYYHKCDEASCSWGMHMMKALSLSLLLWWVPPKCVAAVPLHYYYYYYSCWGDIVVSCDLYPRG